MKQHNFIKKWEWAKTLIIRDRNLLHAQLCVEPFPCITSINLHQNSIFFQLWQWGKRGPEGLVNPKAYRHSIESPHCRTRSNKIISIANIYWVLLSVMHCSRHFTPMALFNAITPWGSYYSINEETEAQSDWVAHNLPVNAGWTRIQTLTAELLPLKQF